MTDNEFNGFHVGAKGSVRRRRPYPVWYVYIAWFFAGAFVTAALAHTMVQGFKATSQPTYAAIKRWCK